MTPPTSLNDLRTRLHNADVTIRINTRTEIIRTRWPTTIDPTTRAELTKRLTAAKPALLAAANGNCAWCTTAPRWAYDHDTGWPICQPCAREVGAALSGVKAVSNATHWLHVEQPELHPTVGAHR